MSISLLQFHKTYHGIRQHKISERLRTLINNGKHKLVIHNMKECNKAILN